ncbi:hypothetical protein Nmel_006099 [Mimus melanotis]
MQLPTLALFWISASVHREETCL